MQGPCPHGYFAEGFDTYNIRTSVHPGSVRIRIDGGVQVHSWHVRASR